MKKKSDFHITGETKRIAPFREKGTGELHSMILQGNDVIRVSVPPYEIIDYNLRRVGSSLRGAKDSAKELLDTSSMFPVALGRRMEWIWFMSEAMKNEHCHWYGLHHVKELKKIDDKRTEIFLYCGRSDMLAVPKNSLANRKKSAHYFQSKLLQSDYLDPFLYSQLPKHYGKVSEGERAPYEINKPKEDKDRK